jgi:hypothetical protein
MASEAPPDSGAGACAQSTTLRRPEQHACSGLIAPVSRREFVDLDGADERTDARDCQLPYPVQVEPLARPSPRFTRQLGAISNRNV